MNIKDVTIEKTYLGDGAYAQYDGYHIILTTENGVSVQNRIALEPSVYDSLVKFGDAVDTMVKEYWNKAEELEKVKEST